LGISRTRLSNHLACPRDCGIVVEADRICPDAEEGLLLMGTSLPLGCASARRAQLARRISLLVTATSSTTSLRRSSPSPPAPSPPPPP